MTNLPMGSTAAVAKDTSRSDFLQLLSEFETNWNAGAYKWDVDALANLYSDDALFFGGRPGLSSGRSAIRAYFNSYKDMLRSVHVRWFDQHIVDLGAEVFSVQGYAEFSFSLQSGRQSTTVLRTTWVLVKRGSIWKIASHHFSPTPDVPPIPQ